MTPRRKQALHDKLTDVLDTSNVRDLVGDRYVAAYQNVEPVRPDRKERYRPSQPGGARLRTDQALVPQPGQDAPRDPFGLHNQVTRARGYQRGEPQLTNELNVIADKPRLDRDVHDLDPDAMPEQLREQQRLERKRGGRGPIDDARRRRGRKAIDDSRRLSEED